MAGGVRYAEGFDVSWNGGRRPNAQFAAAAAKWSSRLGIVRMLAGGEPVVMLEQPYIEFSSVRVALPPEVFLQATRAGEALLQSIVLKEIGHPKKAVDLFSGLGTFTLPLAAVARVHAVDTERAALDALMAAVRATQKLKPVTSEKRDLFRLPLSDLELQHYDAAILDPPRAGALAQVKMLAQSRVEQVTYVSCNPLSFARDARVLTGGGFAMGTVIPIDQFLWSSHIELVAAFSRN